MSSSSSYFSSPQKARARIYRGTEANTKNNNNSGWRLNPAAERNNISSAAEKLATKRNKKKRGGKEKGGEEAAKGGRREGRRTRLTSVLHPRQRGHWKGLNWLCREPQGTAMPPLRSRSPSLLFLLVFSFLFCRRRRNPVDICIVFLLFHGLENTVLMPARGYAGTLVRYVPSEVLD